MHYIESNRLIFRTLTTDDVSSKYVSWLNNSTVNQYLESRFNEQTIESCKSFVTGMNRADEHHLFGIFDKVSLTHIGNIKLGYINKQHLNAQVSLLIGEQEYWGKGIATEAITSITQWGFNAIGLEKIEAGCYDGNLGSLRAFLKVGYVSEGYFRKRVIFNKQRVGCFWLGILKSEFTANDSN